MRLSQEQCNTFAYCIIDSIRQYILDNHDAYSRFLKESYKDSQVELGDTKGCHEDMNAQGNAVVANLSE